MEIDTPAKKEKPKAKEPEPEFELLNNPARVTRMQLQHISFDVDPRYVPISEGVHGVVVLKDTTPGEEEEIVTPAVPKSDEYFLFLLFLSSFSFISTVFLRIAPWKKKKPLSLLLLNTLGKYHP